MSNLRIAVLGHGPVARAFVALVAERRREIEARHRLDVTVSGIRAAQQQVLLALGAAVPPREDWQPADDLVAFLSATGASVMVQAIPSRDELATVATAQVLTAFDAGMDVVTATKSHLVRDWAALRQAAVSSERRIRISGATGAALPASDLARVSLRGFPCQRIRGALNGTSSFVLDRMAAGASLAAAVSEAQALGIAEANVDSDLDGLDAASKVTLLANLLWDLAASVDEVDREPIVAATAARAAEAARKGLRLRSVAVAERKSGRIVVRLEALDDGDPLYALRGPEKAAAFDCGAVGQIVVSGGRASPLGAAHAMLKDVLNLALEGRAGFD